MISLANQIKCKNYYHLWVIKRHRKHQMRQVCCCLALLFLVQKAEAAQASKADIDLTYPSTQDNHQLANAQSLDWQDINAQNSSSQDKAIKQDSGSLPTAISPTEATLNRQDIATAQIGDIERKLERLQRQSDTSNTDLSLGAFDELDATLTDDVNVARIHANAPALGIDELHLDVLNFDKLTTATPSDALEDMPKNTPTQPNPADVEVVSTDELSPENLLPEYQKTAPAALPESAVVDDVIAKQPSLVKRLMGRFFSDGVIASPRLSASVYLASFEGQAPWEQTNNDADVLVPIEQSWQYENDFIANLPTLRQSMTRTEVDAKKQPFANIIAALENITIDQTPSFSVALPRLRQTVESAARAVGYYDVNFHLTHTGNGHIDVVIFELGEPVRITEQIMDIRGQGAQNTEFIALQDESDDKIGQVFNHGDYEATKARVDTLQVDQGFFDGRWLDSSVEVLLPDNTADVSLVYDTGERYRFDEVVFFTTDPATGQLTADPDKLPVKLSILQQLISFEQGDFFERGAVNQLSADLMSTRYFNATNVETVLPESGAEPNKDTPANTAVENTSQTIVLQDEQAGEVQAYIEPIDFSPSQDLLDKLGLVTAKAERLYNSPDDRVLDESTRKRSTNLLGRISDTVSDIVKAILPDESGDEMTVPEGHERPELAGRKTPQQVAADKKVPLYVFVAQDKPRDAQIGVGWGSDTGTRATARIENTLINRAGYQAGVDLAISEIDKGANAYISRPLSHPINDKLIANMRYYEESIAQPSGATLSARTLENGLMRSIIRPSGWNRNYFVRYRLDELETNNNQGVWEDLPEQFYAGQPSQEAVLVGASLSKVIQNHLTAPTQGYRQYYSLEAGSKSLMSDTDLAIAKASFGGMISFGDNSYGQDRAHQLIGRLEAGYLWARDFERVPYKLRFFAGGDQSIRGYDYQSIAPVNDAGYLMGGQVMAVGSLEYNYEFKEGLRLAMFGDVGGAYDKNFTNDTKIGAGVGVRWASPVGTVRVDIAKGIESGSTPIRLHFMIGLPF